VPESLDIQLAGTHVATLDLLAPQSYELRYDSDWLVHNGAVPISLSLPLQPAPIRGGTLTAFLDNLLPDNSDVRDRWALEAGLATPDPFHLLAAYGADTAGALQFVVPGAHSSDPPNRRTITDRDIGERIRAIRDDDTSWQHPGTDTGYFSLGGAQGKFSLGRDDSGWYEPSSSEPTTHIFKPRVRRQSDGELVEYIAMTAARAAGLDTAIVSINEFDGERSLVVERFDRFRDSRGVLHRAHQEDLAQSLGRTRLQKYEERGGPGYREIIRLIDENAAPETRESSLLAFVRALVFSWAVLNTDAHAKNYSVFLRPDGVELTPMYDISSLIPYVGRPDGSPRAMAEVFSSTRLSMRVAADYEAGLQSWFEWLAVAREAGVDRPSLTAWAGAVAENLPDLITAIAETLPAHLQTGTVARLVERTPIRSRQLLSAIDHAGPH
jgi:serine/threonine-protein kinase HipA